MVFDANLNQQTENNQLLHQSLKTTQSHEHIIKHPGSLPNWYNPDENLRHRACVEIGLKVSIIDPVHPSQPSLRERALKSKTPSPVRLSVLLFYSAL